MAHESNIYNKTRNVSRARTIASGVIPFVLVIVLVAYVFGPGSDMLDLGVPLPEITIERVMFVDSEINAIVRNTGPIPVSVVIADVNDRIHPAAVEPDGYLERYETALVRIPFDWNVAEPYVIGITVGDGTRFEREVEAAARSLEPSWDMIGFFAVIGSYVGVIPVLIGLLWLPFMRRMGKSVYVFFLAVTIGLLLFLALDSIEEAVDVSQENLAGSFNGLMLLATSVVLSFLGLYYAGERLVSVRSSKFTRPIVIAMMISIGIGLHNFGEGLAIGAAVGLGSVAFGAFLIIGFAIHNVTEGVAIAAPLSHARVSVWQLGVLGVVAGAPAIFGGWVGGFAFSPFASVIFLGVGAGAIFQVMVVLIRWIGMDSVRAYGSNGNGDSNDDRNDDRNDHSNDNGDNGDTTPDTSRTYGISDNDTLNDSTTRVKHDNKNGLLGAPFAIGIAIGMLIMYITSILV